MNESYAASISKEVHKNPDEISQTGNLKPELLKKDPWSLQDLYRLKSWEMGSQAERNFSAMDADHSGTLSRVELTDFAQNQEGNERDKEVAKKLLEHFEEAKEMATKDTPFALSRWSLAFTGADWYEKRLGNDKATDISLRDVQAMRFSEYGAETWDRVIDYRPTELFHGFSTGLVAAGLFITSNFLPGPAKAVALLGGTGLLATSLRNTFFSTETDYIREIYNRKNQIRSWFPDEKEPTKLEKY